MEDEEQVEIAAFEAKKSSEGASQLDVAMESDEIIPNNEFNLGELADMVADSEEAGGPQPMEIENFTMDDKSQEVVSLVEAEPKQKRAAKPAPKTA